MSTDRAVVLDPRHVLFLTERVKAIYTYEFVIHVPFNNITRMGIGKTRVLIKTRQNKKQKEDE